jgi:molybdopterin/thiamine biosynthesis adenylyltransferase/rhodanese-related sulfurtransferase
VVMPSHGAQTGPLLEGGLLSPLRPDELVRYGRHLSLPGFGTAGQERLRAAKVAIVGLGGLGSPAAMYLAAAGIGTIGLIDGDRVDVSNLQRQVLYGDDDVGQLKVVAAARRLSAQNPNVTLESFSSRIEASNAMAVLEGFDVVLDGSDNFPTRYLVNDATVLLGIPTVHGSVLRFEGRVSVFGTETGPCYRCLYPEPPPPGVVQDCQDAGVLGVLPGLVGVLQATEVIKTICGLGDTLAGRLLIIDGLGLRFQSFGVARDPRCPMCGTREIQSLVDYEAFCGVAGADSFIANLTPAVFATKLASGAQVIDVREPWEWAICRLPGARLVPLGELEREIASLDRGREVVLYCHRGSRSFDAAMRLRGAGFTHVSHLEGGIDRWSVDIDASVARY